ncbi:iron-uptake system-binding protein [Paenibacillus glucanolyticus]|uniref:ABC transporter substrate-binding protein n=1 Tax=Paenibacillus TaxID=44249 RepID=UPI0004B81493|nr:MULTISPECIES: ABC transporter substrate-binding protein [Paenibacillus]ANA79205.1 iron-uptake system-binding protein [Paenibacillus glucanolyticus]AVV60166.1 iron-uptake system-binding protein [Paenibacillus glucanolyticus]
MKRMKWVLGLLMVFTLVLSACGGGNEVKDTDAASTNGAAETSKPAEESTSNEEAKTAESDTKVVKYLDQEYTLPAKTDRIVITGAVEAMEDAIVLDVNPVGAITFSGKFPPMFESITKEATSVGEKMEPNFESILSLKPDVILGSSKAKPEVIEQLNKIAPTIPYSHVSTNWESNLKLLGELSGKQEQAEQEIAKYKEDLEEVKTTLGDSLKDKKVLAIRIRAGEMYIYPAGVFFNPVLYEDLGIAVPAEVAAAKAQELISKEKIAEMNPDYVFVQFSPDENKDTPNALEELQNDPIMKNLNAFKNGTAFVNVVDPLAQGGTAYSKIMFLKAAVENLTK